MKFENSDQPQAVDAAGANDIPVLSHAEYKKKRVALDDLLNLEMNPDGKKSTEEFTFNLDDEGNMTFVDEIVTRGPGTMVTTKAIANPDPLVPMRLKAREDIGAYQIFAGTGSDTGGAFILSKDKALVRKIHDEVVRRGKGEGADALREIMDEYEDTMSEDYPDRMLIEWQG